MSFDGTSARVSDQAAEDCCSRIVERQSLRLSTPRFNIFLRRSSVEDARFASNVTILGSDCLLLGPLLGYRPKQQRTCCFTIVERQSLPLSTPRFNIFLRRSSVEDARFASNVTILGSECLLVGPLLGYRPKQQRTAALQ